MKPTPDVTDHQARLLIVDDERSNRQLLEIMLAPSGFLVQSAASGEEALELVREQPPDLILLDIMMPGMDGYQVAAAIKGNVATRNIPIIMVTALDDRQARMLGLTAGAEDFLTKPVDRAELATRVRNLLRLKAYADYHDKYGQMLEVEVSSTAERMRFALENAGVGIWDMDYSTGTLRWSAILESHYGLAPGAFGGTFAAFIDRVHPDDRASVQATLDSAAVSGAVFSLDNRSIQPDGTVRWLSGSGRFHLGSDGLPVRGVGISQDVTARRMLEAQQQQASKMEAVGQLAAGVAHDFNNLLTAITGFAELIATSVEPGGQTEMDLREILNAARRATDLTGQLLAFSRRQVMHAEPVDVNGLITDLARMLDRLIGHGILVSLNLAPSLGVALADRGQLESVVMNLVVNARDAMPDGGTVTIQTGDVELGAGTFDDEAVVAGAYVMIAVADTGTGMSAETQRRLFEPFYTTKETGKGTGLGLSTTYGIVKQSQGHIRVDSELGKGTTFRVYLPRAIAAAPPVRDAHRRNAAKRSSSAVN